MKKILDSNYQHLSSFIDRLPEGGFAEGGIMLHDIRNQVKLFEVDGKKLVVKKFKTPKLFNRIMYTFIRGTKAKRAYNNARLLKEKYGVETPHVIAYIDVIRNGLVSNSYLVTEYTDYKPISDLLHEERYLQAMGVNALAVFTADLHQKGIKHKDFNNTNIRYSIRDNAGFDFSLIDINRMSFGKMSRRSCIGNLTRICEEPRLIYYFSQKYAEVRGWDSNYCLSQLAFQRGLYENRKKAKSYLKNILQPKAAH